MGLNFIHLLPIEGKKTSRHVKRLDGESCDLSAAEPVVQEQTHEQGISSSLWGIALFLEYPCLFWGNGDGFCFLVTDSGHLSFGIDVSALLVSIAAHHLDHGIRFRWKDSCFGCQFRIDLDG